MTLLGVVIGEAESCWSDEEGFYVRVEKPNGEQSVYVELEPAQFEDLRVSMNRLHDMHLTRNMNIRSR